MGVVITLVFILYGMYVHIKSITNVTFPHKKGFLSKLIRQKYKRNCQTRIYYCCMPHILFVMYYLAN